MTDKVIATHLKVEYKKKSVTTISQKTQNFEEDFRYMLYLSAFHMETLHKSKANEIGKSQNVEIA